MSVNMSQRSSSGSSTPSRSRSNTLSQPFQFTSLQGNGGGSGTSTPPRNSNSAASSRNNSPTRPPGTFSPPSPRLSSQNAYIPSHSPTTPTRTPESPLRMRSQSTASLGQQTHGYPTQVQPVFATPGGYYAYPFYTQAPPSMSPQQDGSGLRASYSSPHLPYAFDAAAAIQSQQYQSQLPPPYPYPSYPYNMNPQPQPQLPPPPPPPPIDFPNGPTRRDRRHREWDRDQDSTSDDDDGIAFNSNSGRRGLRTRVRSDSHTSNGAGGHGGEYPEITRRPKKKRSTILVDETETDEPLRHSARRPSPPGTPNALHPSLTALVSPIIFLFRILSIVPASVGCISHAWDLFQTSRHVGYNTRLDYFVSFLWSALTAYQCLALANGLFQRWKIYYPLFPTLIRLLALQAICWPATHLTLRILGGRQRPLICWIVIGTTTCVSRSIQIWVTSNLGGDAKAKGKTKDDEGRRTREWISMGSGLGLGVGSGKRWWDWNEIALKCVLPATVLYFVSAWALLFRREFAGC